MDLRQLHEELGAELPHLTWDQLKELAEFAKVPVDKVRKKHVIVHLINEEIDVVIEKEDKEAARQFIGDVLELIKRMKNENAREAEKSLSEDEDELAKLKKQYADLQLMFQSSTKSLESEITRLSDQGTFSTGQFHKQLRPDAKEFYPGTTNEPAEMDSSSTEPAEHHEKGMEEGEEEGISVSEEEQSSETEEVVRFEREPELLRTESNEDICELDEDGVQRLEPALPQRLYPLRKRKQKQTFTYHTLGQPTLE
ncbi:hypothetical protein Q7C36_016783 [Tachysurus vachellii]|uniref:Uncharacterized protein n=1 Tax=Tachysurus vachellii TaxID=175792 RepID=A0AA88M879_TACVA|nr:hypothetical protein Q7C36_016783 [Tachysurus vachellii]